MDSLASVIVPTHNGERTIRQAIDSALSQTGLANALEIIVVDDGSTDSTPAILADYGDRIRAFRQIPPRPPASRISATKEPPSS